MSNSTGVTNNGPLRAERGSNSMSTMYESLAVSFQVTVEVFTVQINIENQEYSVELYYDENPRQEVNGMATGPFVRYVEKIVRRGVAVLPCSRNTILENSEGWPSGNYAVGVSFKLRIQSDRIRRSDVDSVDLLMCLVIMAV